MTAMPAVGIDQAYEYLVGSRCMHSCRQGAPGMQALARVPDFWKLLLREGSVHMRRLIPAALVASGVCPSHFTVGNSTNSYVLDLRSHYDRGITCFLLEWNRLMRKRLHLHRCAMSVRCVMSYFP